MKLIPLFKSLHVGEHNSRTLRVQIDEDFYLDKSIKLFFKTPDGNNFISDVLVLDGKSTEYALPSDLLKAEGYLYAQIQIYDGSELIVRSDVHKFFVNPSIDPFAEPPYPPTEGEHVENIADLADRINYISDNIHSVVAEEVSEYMDEGFSDLIAQLVAEQVDDFRQNVFEPSLENVVTGIRLGDNDLILYPENGILSISTDDLLGAIPVAGDENLGLVKGSNNTNEISIGNDGTMSINQIDIQNLTQEGWLVLDSHGA